MKSNTKIEQHPTANGMKLVKRYRAGRVYACVWNSDTPNDVIMREVNNGWAKFRAFNESTATFIS